jgi:hypothetical protein
MLLVKLTTLGAVELTELREKSEPSDHRSLELSRATTPLPAPSSGGSGGELAPRLATGTSNCCAALKSVLWPFGLAIAGRLHWRKTRVRKGKKRKVCGSFRRNYPSNT